MKIGTAETQSAFPARSLQLDHALGRVIIHSETFSAGQRHRRAVVPEADELLGRGHIAVLLYSTA